MRIYVVAFRCLIQIFFMIIQSHIHCLLLGVMNNVCPIIYMQIMIVCILIIITLLIIEH